MKIVATLAMTVVSSAALARMPAPSAYPPPTIRVTGRGEVSAVPNRVYIDFGVTTQAPKSQAAAARNAHRFRAVIAAIRKSAGPGAQLTTTQYIVTPDYQSLPNGKAPTLVGYTATNETRIRLDDLARIGKIIDAATRAGANRVENIRFALRDPAQARTTALREAAMNARGEARALAGALALRIVRILSVEVSNPPIVPFHTIYARALMRPLGRIPTPVEPGTLTTRASVTLTVEVAPRGPGRRARH